MMWGMTMLDVAAIWMPNTQQQNYRALLDAMSRPGMVKTIQQESKQQICTAILATLLDAEVSFADPDGLLSDEVWPMLQAIKTEPQAADYILCSGAKPPSFQPKLGSLPSPEESATIIIKVDSLREGDMTLCLSGPGVDGNICCSIDGLDPAWLKQRESWVSAFPLGVDLLLADDAAVLALPRTTKVEMN
jgi:alpha-D-ribose 1-methylphosphonate 5-triphosphate synthase subunit PhnH